MTRVKQMSAEEKYRRARDAYAHDTYMFPFIEERLGPDALKDYRRRYDCCMETIPDDAPWQTKYEVAFRIWMRECSASYDFVREHLGEQGIAQMADVSVEALKREDPRATLAALRLIRAVSPRLAFKMVAKTFAYEFQWLTPYAIEELSGDRAVFRIPRCRIRTYPDSDDTCRVACRGEYPRWLREHYGVVMDTAPCGESCTVTFTRPR